MRINTMNVVDVLFGLFNVMSHIWNLNTKKKQILINKSIEITSIGCYRLNNIELRIWIRISLNQWQITLMMISRFDSERFNGRFPLPDWLIFCKKQCEISIFHDQEKGHWNKFAEQNHLFSPKIQLKIKQKFGAIVKFCHKQWDLFLNSTDWMCQLFHVLQILFLLWLKFIE